MQQVYVLGGSQSDFARNITREGSSAFELFSEVTFAALDNAQVDPEDIDVGHVGNFVAELFVKQGQLGGFFGHLSPAFSDLPTSRHEAACASGSVAILAAMRELMLGHYQCALVTGIEIMRNVDGRTGAEYLGAAAWQGQEATDCEFPWPHLFDRIATEYDSRYGLKHEYLAGIAEINFANGKRNPLAQTREWRIDDAAFYAPYSGNPSIEGAIRKLDCGQITDGAASIVLANEAFAKVWAAKRCIPLADVPRIKGWGHRSAPLLLEEKIRISQGEPLIFPHVAKAFKEALNRAGMNDIRETDGLETHDCFTATEYMAIDHSGLTAPGQSWRAVEEGLIAADGDFPINPSGGLMGLGHPVGATGVRMLLDAHRQVSRTAGAAQVAEANNFMTFNMGGSATTCVNFVVGRD
jgi:acetyl-CoA C-acetyltransferase